MSNSAWAITTLSKKFTPLAAVSILVAAAGLVRLAVTMSATEPAGWLRLILSGYDSLISLVFSAFVDWWFPALVEYLVSFFKWDFALFPQWRDAFALLALYFASHVKQARAANVPNPRLAFLVRLLSAILGVIGAAVAASVAFTQDNSTLVGIFVACLTGIAIYRIGFAAQFAFDLRKVGFWHQFADKARGAATIGVGGLTILVIGLVSIRHSSPAATGTLNALFLFLFVLFLAAYHLSLAGLLEWRAGWSDGSWERVRSTGHYEIGWRILLAWLGAVGTLVVAAKT